MYYYIFGFVGVALVLWTIGSYAVVWSIETPSYTVIEKKEGYEIREYAPYIIAQTTVTGNYDDATTQGFRIIADYIFGNNVTKESVAMTSPVLESRSEKIAMTTPVLEAGRGSDTRTIAFVLPSKYTLETLPLPNNAAVTLTPVPARKVAALSFTWYPTEARVTAKKELLQSYLVRDAQRMVGDIETARYNPPASMPLTLRNEILIPIQ
jgi:hypothetical protein